MRPPGSDQGLPPRGASLTDAVVEEIPAWSAGGVGATEPTNADYQLGLRVDSAPITSLLPSATWLSAVCDSLVCP
jgi:hypothetical protein